MAICVLLLIASLFRFSLPGRLAVEHFDEGVYASNIWFGDRPEGTYPSQHLYAPPLLPALIEWGFVFGGPSNYAAMWSSQVAGVLSVLLLWQLGRSWFGPVAGLVAGALCATNDVLILLSRSALTDSLLGLWWLAALWSLRRACESGRPGDRLTAGLLVGLAWYTKYNGWMPLGIVMGAVLLRGVVCRGIRSQTRTALASCLVAGAIAFATWSPWLWSLQSKGGYSSVSANHRQYIVGPQGWWQSAVRQSEQLTALLGPVSECGLIGCYLVLLVLVARRLPAARAGDLPLSPHSDRCTLTPRRWSSIWTSASWVCLLVFCLVSLYSPLLGIMAIVSQGLVLSWWTTRRGADATPEARPIDLGYWILLVWFGGLLVATPLYTPYLRLTSPWVLAVCLGVGLTFQQAWQLGCQPGRLGSTSPNFMWGALSPAAAVVLAALIAFNLPSANPAHPTVENSWLRSIPNQSSLRTAAAKLTLTIAAATQASGQADLPAVVYVYAEPSLLFQLRNSGLQHVAPVSGLQFSHTQFSNAAVRVYLAVGIHAHRDPHFREQFAAASSQFRRVGSWPWHLGPLVALDQPDCRPELLGSNPVESATVELYEVLPP